MERGRAKSLSAWVNDALRLKVEHDRRLAALADFIAEYEAEHGEISVDEIHAAGRGARVRSRVVAPAATSGAPPDALGDNMCTSRPLAGHERPNATQPRFGRNLAAP